MNRAMQGGIRRLEVVGLAAILMAAVFGTVGTGRATAATSGPRVLYVGMFGGITTPKSSTFKTIQAAVDAAKPSDWILIAPGDYHETGDMGSNAPSAADLSDGWYGGVDITTPRIHLRGMNRNSVIVDGTLAKASTPCSSAASDQNTLHGKGAQRDPGLEGQRSQRREPDGVQFPCRIRQRRQRDLVERRLGLVQDRPQRLRGQLPDGDIHLLQRQRSEESERVRHVRPLRDLLF